MMLLTSLINYVHKTYWLLSISFFSLLFHSIGFLPVVIASFNSHLQKKKASRDKISSLLTMNS